MIKLGHAFERMPNTGVKGVATSRGTASGDGIDA